MSEWGPIFDEAQREYDTPPDWKDDVDQPEFDEDDWEGYGY